MKVLRLQPIWVHRKATTFNSVGTSTTSGKLKVPMAIRLQESDMVTPGCVHLHEIPEKPHPLCPTESGIGTRGLLVSGNRAASSSCSDSVFERSDELATRRPGQEDFTDNPEPTEAHAPAHFSGLRFGTSYKSGNDIEEAQYFPFPKDGYCDVCWRTKITKASCRRRTGQALLRAEKFGDLTTADHKVLNEGCESRDNHRYAVVVGRKMSFLKFLEPSQAPKVVFTDNSMEFGRACDV